MGELHTYSDVSGMLPFESGVFLALVRHFNESIWPSQILWVLIGITTLVALKKFPDRSFARRGLFFVLGASYLFTGYFFHQRIFSWVIPMAPVIYWAFYVQAALFILLGTLLDLFRVDLKRLNPGLFLIVFVSFVPIELFIGADFAELRLFGWSGARMSLVTLVSLFMFERKLGSFFLAAIPALYLLFSGFLYWGLFL